ncbi:hypothetical protein G7Y79_00052g087870 [Physcia stellaris]|nr:hypothetical protein G7Y79_00052g087870 [Physcia stellaris]
MSPPNPGSTTVIRSGSESVTGSYLLHDRLKISTISGSISITIAAISDVHGPAELQISSVSGSITVNMEHLRSHPSELPDRLIDTDIYSTSGTIDVSLIHNHRTTIKTTSARIDARLYPGFASPFLSSQIQLANTSGATRMELHPLPLAPKTPLRSLSTSFNGVSGSVDLTYPLTWEGGVEVRTVSGSLKCSDWHRLHVLSTGPRTSATVGKGEGEIWVRGTSNAVRLRGSHYGNPQIIEKMKDNEVLANMEESQGNSAEAPPSYEEVMNM